MMAENKRTKNLKKLEEYKKPNEEVEKIAEKVQKGEDVNDIEKEIKKEDRKEAEVEKEKVEEKKEIKNEKKPELEREYIIPLRKKARKVPRYKRARKAIKVIKEFLARHMKVEERDLRKIKIDKWLNNEIWFRGIKKPPAKIKVKASKIDGVVKVELAEIPEKIKWKIQKEEKAKKETAKVKKAKAVKKESSTEKTEEKKKEEEEKEKASAEAGLERQKIEAKKIEHTSVKIPAGEKFERPEGQFKRKAMKR